MPECAIKPEDFELKNEQHRALLRNLDTLNKFGVFRDIGNLTEAISLNHGFGVKWNEYVEKLGFEEALDVFICKATTLQTSEVSEIVEEARLQDRSFEHMLEEIADVIIRSINLATLLMREGKDRGLLDEHVTLGNIIRDKTARNIERPYGHGKKRF